MRKSGRKKSEKRNHIRELSSLKEENRILRAEVKRLNRALRVYSSSEPSLKERFTEKSRERRLFEYTKASSVALASSTYFKYALARLSAASVYYLIKKITKGFRRFRLFSTVIRITSYVLTILGTSAFFIFISGTLIFFIPLFLLIGSSAYLASMLFRKKAFKDLEEKLKNKNIFVLFPAAGRSFERSSHFTRSLDIISSVAKTEVLVLIVSPFLISGKGFGGKGYYPVVREENKNIYLIRRNAFFALRRKLLGGRRERVTYIY